MHPKSQLTESEYERFSQVVTAGTLLCSDVQLLALASQINHQLGRRRARLDQRSFAAAVCGSGASLS